MKITVLALVIGAFQLGTICPAAAKDVIGARDYPGMPRFEGSSLIGSETLPLGLFPTNPRGPASRLRT